MRVRELFLDVLTGAALISCVVTVALVVKRELSAKPAQSADVKARPVKDWETYIPTGHLVGPLKAPVVLVELADFQCPACRSLHNLLQKMQADNPGKLAISYHYAPLSYHPLAYPAARAAECAAEQGRFEAYYDILFSRFDSLSTDSFVNLAAKSGIPDLSSFKRCAARTDSVQRINAGLALAFDTLHITGTPTVLLQGMMYNFAPPLDELRRIIKTTSSSESQQR